MVPIQGLGTDFFMVRRHSKAAILLFICAALAAFVPARSIAEDAGTLGATGSPAGIRSTAEDDGGHRLAFEVLNSPSASGASEESETVPGPVHVLAPGGALIFKSGAPKHPYDTILINGLVLSGRVGLEIALEAPGERKVAWQSVPLHLSRSGRFWAKLKLTKPARGPVAFRVTNQESLESRVIVYGLETFAWKVEAPSGARRPPAQSSGDPVAPGARRPMTQVIITTGDQPPVIERAAWSAKDPRTELEESRPTRMTLHHTAGNRPLSRDESIQEVQWIQEFHQNGRGWSDIGYHFLIDPLGNIFRGRPELKIGAHTLGENQGNLGIAFLGFYEPPHDHRMSAEQEKSFLTLAAWLLKTYAISPETLVGHQFYRPTTCPGKWLQREIAGLREKLKNEAAAPLAHPGPRSSPGATGASGSQGTVPGAAQGAAAQRSRRPQAPPVFPSGLFQAIRRD
ncbi:MAG: N-acetylmuramoyl-L-alanine amidase, partial [Elusimicrobia bacterium]|nr:N-acetylmuramoyl-L-alanine amidase [Elusimicrobiota bacterium]